jgi:hypothetical protein
VQFDEFVLAVVLAAGQVGRAEVNFTDDHRADLRPAVRGAEGRLNLRHEMLFAQTGDVATEGDAALRRAEGKAVDVAGEVGVGVAGEQIHFVAQ